MEATPNLMTPHMANEPELDRHELENALNIVTSWDFQLTKQKLLERDYAGWTQERADIAELGYKRYLAVIRALNGYRPVPNADIDRFWHEHILDTERYASDCQALFGKFLHHYPYFGMRGDSDQGNWIAASNFSSQVWAEAFGEPLYKRRSQRTTSAATNPNALSFNIPTEDLENDMSVTISITINVNGKSSETQIPSQQLAADIMKCPQKCPDRETIVAPAEALQPDEEIMKCPQKCPDKQ
jgi:hypothetical protein